MTKTFEMELIITKQVYYDEGRRFGIYGCDTVEYNREVEKNKYGNFSIQGNTRRLAEGEKYTIKFEGTYSHAKYGNFYKILKVQEEKLDTQDAQDKFLREILSDAHFKSLKNAYPKEKLVDFILAGNIDIKKTKGIKAKALIRIKEKIQENMQLAVLIAKLSDLSISSTKLYKILDHFGNPDLALRAIDENIYSLCDIKSLGFKTVDAIAMHRGDDPNNEQRIHACLKYTLNEDANDGHTWSIREHLLATCSDLLNMPMSKIDLILADMKKSIIYQSGNAVSLASIRSKEISVLEELIRIRDSYTPPNLQNIEFNIRKTEAEQGYAFTNEQFKAIVEGSQHGVMILNGVAGSGKSASVKGLIDSLDGVSYMTCALSGKAVNVLAQRGIEASTIHRMLKMKDGQFVHGEENPLPYQVVVVDEVSMINIPLMLSVLKAVANGTKLIIVGDSGQLPAIGYGDVLRDLLSTDFFAKFELTQVHRQAAKSGILSLANSIRIGEQVFPYNSSGKETFGELQDQTVISYANKDSIVSDLLNIALAYKERIKSPEDMYDFQVIVANKSRGDLSVKNLNYHLQGIFNDMSKPFLNRNGYEFREGDKIITQGNAYNVLKFDSIEHHDEMMEDYRMNGNSSLNSEEDESEDMFASYRFDFFNGTLGYIDTIQTENKRVFIRLDGHEGVIPLLESELDKIDMAYAATVHKLQGSSIKNVIFALDFAAYKLLSKQLVYTALTRTSSKGVALVENNALFQAIKNDSSQSRRTFLQELIKLKMIK